MLAIGTEKKLKKMSKNLTEIFEQWRDFLRTTPDLPEDWKRGVYTFFAKDLAHN